MFRAGNVGRTPLGRPARKLDKAPHGIADPLREEHFLLLCPELVQLSKCLLRKQSLTETL